MTQDHDPLDDTRQFQPIDPYNIGPDTAGAPLPGYEDGYQAEYGAPAPAAQPAPPRGLRQRLGRLGAPKLAALGAGAVIVIGGAAWGTTAALASSNSTASPQAQGQNPVAGAPSTGKKGKGGAESGAKAGAKNGAKAARVTITKVDAGSFTGTDGKGMTVTVVYGDDTKFGTKARPLSSDQLQPGMAVTVAGTRSGDTITALLIAAPAKKAEATPAPSSSTVSG